jgi:hypothetical protein
MNSVTEMITTIALAIAGVAALAVFVSKNAQSPAIIQNFGSAYANALDVAVSPVTGNSSPPQLAYAGGQGIGVGNFTPNNQMLQYG